LRFYADGTVLNASSKGTPQDVARWLDKNHKDNGTACATVTSGRLQIVEPLVDGKIEYTGAIRGSDLALQVVNCSRGYAADRIYRFFPMHFEDDPGHVPSSPRDSCATRKGGQ